MARNSIVVIKPLVSGGRKGRSPAIKPISTPPITHGVFRTGKTAKAPMPTPQQLGVQSQDEMRAYMALIKAGIQFDTQINFDGGTDLMGGMRADFVLWDRMVVIEILGPWHDVPAQTLKDDRKWDKRRQEGWQVHPVRTDAPDFEAQVVAAAGVAVH